MRKRPKQESVASTVCATSRHDTTRGSGMRQKAAVVSFLAMFLAACFDPVAQAFSSSTTALLSTTLQRQSVVLFATISNNDTVEFSTQGAKRLGGGTGGPSTWAADGQQNVEAAPLEKYWLSETNLLHESASYEANSQPSPSTFDLKEPFFAERRSTVMVRGHFPLNGNVVVHGKNVAKVPPPVNGKIVEKKSNGIDMPPPLVNAPEKTSFVRRALGAARLVWGQVSPNRIFRFVYNVDAAATTKIDSESTQTVASAEKSKKRSKEEATLARISRRKKKQLSNLLKSVNRQNTKSMAGITSRTLTGLITALAEEAEGVSVRMLAREDTPLWRKQIDSVSIEFTRLGFKPLHMGGPDQQLVSASDEKGSKNKQGLQIRAPQWPTPQPQTTIVEDDETDDCPVKFILDEDGNPIADISCADNAFNQIDVDNSGALDKDEIADALVIAASAASATSSQSDDSDPDIEVGNREIIQKLAEQLVNLYDTNDDGVIDRGEYQSMVEDMAALRQEVQREKEGKESKNSLSFDYIGSWWASTLGFFMRGNNESKKESGPGIPGGDELAGEVIVEMNNATVPETTGKILLEGLKIDLRQLVFGALPIVRHIMPGGPLFLEPLKVTVIGSFSADDIMKSSLLDAGLRQLVSFALRVRVRSFRDMVDGAVFYGRQWKRGSEKAPLVQCTELTSVEIDKYDRIIITGRAKVRASKDAPVIDNSFKLRTKVATPRNGRAIKLSEPEIAIVFECPNKWEENLNATFAKLKMEPPPRPKPIYTYIPIHSPFHKDDDTGGYYMGEDNRLKSLYIKDKCLRFEMEAILRPGRFLGSHYLAFTVPQRALILTVDRVKEGMRAARRRKKALKALNKARTKESDANAHLAKDALARDKVDLDASLTNPASPVIGVGEALQPQDEKKDEEAPAKGFISRFVDGYVQAGAAEESKEMLANAISDWFGRQGISSLKLGSEQNDKGEESI